MAHRIVTLPGDGIGPEIMTAALRVLDAVGDFTYDERPFGGAKWDSTDPDAPRPEQGLLGLRKGLGLYANLRPVRPVPALYDASPLRRDVIEGTDLLVVRELTGGIYFGDKGRNGD